MANTIDWGQGQKQNSIDWGQGATDNTINWGKSQTLSPGGETNISGASSFTNTLSTRFDGVDDSVSMGNPASLQITGALTISAWFNTTHTGSQIIVGKDGVDSLANNRAYLLIYSASSNTMKFIIFNSINTFEQAISTTSVTDGNWHHVVGVNDGTDLKIYIDGVLENTNVGGGGTIQNSSATDFYIGRRQGTSNGNHKNFWKGAIDEVSVFNTGLSASAVTTIYNSGAPNDLTGTSGLASWWRMGDGDTFPTITDNQGSNNGTMTNMSSGNFITNVPT